MLPAAERRLFLGTFLLAAVFAAPLRDSTGVAALVALDALRHGHVSLGKDAEVVGDRAFVPSRPSAAAAALGDSSAATLPLVGRAYYGNAPGAIFLWEPIHLGARAVLPERLVLLALIVLGAALPHALGTIGARRAVLRATACTEDEATLAALTFGVGTIALPLATRPYAHALSVAAIAWALALVLGRDRRGAALAGFLGAAAFACHYSCAIPLAALGALALLQGGVGGAAAFVLGAAPVALALLAHNAACFGSPLATAYDFRVQPDLRALLDRRLGFSVPHPAIVGELLLGPRRGILFSQPVVFVGLAGLVALARRRDRTALVALAAFVLVLLANASRVHDWAGGLSFGSRYSSGALPFVALGLPAGFALAGRAGKAALAASIALAVAACATNWGFSVPLTLDTLVRLGPRTVGVADLALGEGDHELDGRALLVAVVALGVALPAAAVLLGVEPRSARRRGLLVALALLPALLALSFAATLARSGAPGAAAVERALLRREMLADLETAWHAQQARRMAGSAVRVGDALVYARAVERTVELDPQDASARAELDRLRAVLRRRGE